MALSRRGYRRKRHREEVLARRPTPVSTLRALSPAYKTEDARSFANSWNDLMGVFWIEKCRYQATG
jgi:hypothetical protein